jgi:AICAR transformylase/IMP cyclohydrolase PurH
MDKALIHHVATAIAKVDDMTPQDYGYPNNMDQGWEYISEQAEAAIKAVQSYKHTSPVGIELGGTMAELNAQDHSHPPQNSREKK